MAGETILIVEDAPDSLRFAASVLRNEGYKVQIASTAEQALSTLRFLQPQLILVDFMLPGMSGLELTTRVKQDPRLQKTIVVALTGCALPDDESKARQAGCDGYLIKPIDARTLSARIREFLTSGTIPAADAGRAETASTNAFVLPEEELAELQESFLKSGKPLSRQLLDSLDAQFDESRAQRTVHQWIGTAGLLNFPNVAYRARDVEQFLRTPPWTASRLRGPLTNLARSFYQPDADPQASSQATIRALEGKRIALIGVSSDEADRMCTAMEHVGAKARLFEGDESPFAETVGFCHLAVVHVRPENRSSRWLHGETPGLPILPTLYLGAPEDLIALLPEVQERACGLVTEGSLPYEILLRFRLAISQSQPIRQVSAGGSGELVLADSDESCGAPVQKLLQAHGIACRVATTGVEAIVLVQHLQPKVTVVDSLEVLAAIRTQSSPVRPLYLTSRPPEDEILRAFSLGAEDYLERPFSPVELVARVKRLM